MKVRAHRGEPYNEVADRIASTGTRDEDVSLLWNAPSGRIIYQFTPDPCESEDTLYTASVNDDTVKKFIKNQAALSTLYPIRSFGVTESFLRRPHRSRDLLIECLSRSSFPEKDKKRLMQLCTRSCSNTHTHAIGWLPISQSGSPPPMGQGGLSQLPLLPRARIPGTFSEPLQGLGKATNCCPPHDMVRDSPPTS